MRVTREALLGTARGALLQALAEQGARMPDAIDEDTVVFGKGALLDSLGLVTMVMELEQRLEEEHGVTVVLADERAMSRRSSPFRSLGTLLDHIRDQLDRTAA